VRGEPCSRLATLSSLDRKDLERVASPLGGCSNSTLDQVEPQWITLITLQLRAEPRKAGRQDGPDAPRHHRKCNRCVLDAQQRDATIWCSRRFRSGPAGLDPIAMGRRLAVTLDHRRAPASSKRGPAAEVGVCGSGPTWDARDTRPVRGWPTPMSPTRLRRTQRYRLLYLKSPVMRATRGNLIDDWPAQPRSGIALQATSPAAPGTPLSRHARHATSLSAH
jgi:hypothetical protein